MDPLVQDWIDFCEGRGIFDRSHFFTLFRGSISLQDLERIFSYFPYSDELVTRALNVLDAGTFNAPAGRVYMYLQPKPENRGTPEELMILVTKYISEQKRLLATIGEAEVCAVLDQLKPVYVDKLRFEEILQADENSGKRYDGLYYAIGDFETDVMRSKEKQMYRLLEALYGLSANYDLARYIGAPLLNTDLDFGYYFEFWKKGGQYVLSHDEILVRHVASD